MLDQRLFHQQMLAAYREIAPEAGAAGEFLVRQLATAMYSRGARMEIGAEPPLKKQVLHHSLDADCRFTWVGKVWSRVMGIRPHAAVGRHVSEVLAPHSMGTFMERWWPEMQGRGRAGPCEIALVAGETTVIGEAKGEALKDESGVFLRTFTRIAVFLPHTALFIPLCANLAA